MRKPAPASPDNKTSVDLLIEQRKRQAQQKIGITQHLMGAKQ